jgi:creatinine amidohydrolase
VGTLVREFFEETRVPILYIDMDRYLPRLQLPAEARSRFLWGGHYIAGRLEDLPLKGDYAPGESKAAAPVPPNEGLATLGKLGLSGSLSLGSWISDVMAHGAQETPLPATPQEREAWGKQGREQMIAVVKKMSLNEAMEALRKHDRYTQEVIVPRLGKWAPQ